MYRDTGLARVFTLTEEALASVLGPGPIPYRPPQIPYVTEKGAYLHAPLIQAAGKTGRPRGTSLGQLGGSPYQHEDSEFQIGDTVILIIQRHDLEKKLIFGKILTLWRTER